MTNLTFWRGNTPFDQFRREVDRLFTSFLSSFYNPTAATASADTTTWTPACELFETDKTYVVRAELPGCSDKDIDVQVASNQLNIRGERRIENEETRGTCHFTERNYGTFFRSFTLPTTVDTTKIRARYDRGVLEIEMPKTTGGTLTKVKVEQK
ncbi:MAG: Hsp20/alpha crystallin family protein [Myxococcales bacterium]|nr:Hsp20/alpha crystallin family protein [Myxococcota bacterium]MDW8282147.1 Hsp20/alpha crystallin family protein [Myxococcales bacterium]